MKKANTQKLAESLTAKTVDVLPYIPYVLQDFFELGSDVDVMVDILKRNAAGIHCVLDLCCGKGAVSIALAKEFGCHVRGIDIMEKFLDVASQKAEEAGVLPQCEFITEDVERAVKREKNYDCTVWGAVGNLLGTYPETMEQVCGTVKKGGYLLVDDAYVDYPGINKKLRYPQEYPTYEEWLSIFFRLHMTLVDCVEAQPPTNEDTEASMALINNRVEELCVQFPDKAELLRGYAKSQLDEYEDMRDYAAGAVWLLQKQA